MPDLFVLGRGLTFRQLAEVPRWWPGFQTDR